MPKNEESLKLIKFQKSTSSGKKYDALIQDTKTKSIKKVSFGALGYEQYRDSTGLHIYSHLDHNDTKRRVNYRKRHAGNINVKWSPGWFSGKYLW